MARRASKLNDDDKTVIYTSVMVNVEMQTFTLSKYNVLELKFGTYFLSKA